MPNRILREGILTSARVAKLGWAEEVFYRRLMSVVDDFGRYYADAGMLRAACYPRLLNKVSDSDVGKWLASCATAALVRVYEADDSERYLELLDFKQQVRAKDSKFPHARTGCVADAQQLKSFAHLDVSVDVSVSAAQNDVLFDRFYESYPRHIGRQKAREAWEKLKLVADDPRIDEMRRGLAVAKQSRDWLKDGGQFVPHPATWLNQGRWTDEHTPANVAQIYSSKVAL